MASINKQLILALGLTLSLSGIVSAQNATKCPNWVDVEVDLDLSRYSGMWYSMARVKGAPFESGNCG